MKTIIKSLVFVGIMIGAAKSWGFWGIIAVVIIIEGYRIWRDKE